MNIRLRMLWGVAAVAVILVPQSTIQSAIRSPQSAMTRTAAPSAWRTLFDGKSLSAFRGYKTEGVPEGWKIEKGTLAKDGHAGDLITKDEFGDFELDLEWKIGKAGNSGIFYRGIEDPDFTGRPNDDRIYTTGPEYQLLDDLEAADKKPRITCARATY